MSNRFRPRMGLFLSFIYENDLKTTLVLLFIAIRYSYSYKNKQEQTSHINLFLWFWSIIMTSFLNVRWDHFHSPSYHSNSPSKSRARSPGDDWGTPTKRRRQQRVHFQEKVVSSVVVMEDHQASPSSIWYSTQELQETADELKAMVKEARRNSIGRYQPLGDHFRGLEDVMSVQLMKERRRRQNGVLQSVLREQARQSLLNINDPILLGKRSARASQCSREKAIMRARSDVTDTDTYGVSNYFFRR